ncbi:MAG: hypothetical protein ACR2G0_13645 [Chthoniobacterales bacterium]
MKLRERLGMFVLTRQEQGTIAFVVLAVLLGLCTQHYRRAKSEVKTSSIDPARTTQVSPSPAALSDRSNSPR